MKKFWIVLAAALVVVLLVVWQASTRKAGAPEYGVELLRNGDFEDLDQDGVPEDWYTESYLGYSEVTQYAPTEGVEGRGVGITNLSPNDARYAQTVRVQPGTTYRLSGMIKADAEGGRGANLSIADVYVFSEAVFDTAGEWKQVELYGQTGSKQQTLTVFARLGGYSGEATGEASFDTLSLVALEKAPDSAAVFSWAKPEAQQQAVSSTPQAARPFAPWFLVIAVAMGGLMLALAKAARQADDLRAIEKRDNKEALYLGILLVIAVATRLFIAVRAPGFPVDLGAFRAWANDMAQEGPARFYLLGGHRDYPPGYMLLLWPLGILGRWLGTGTTELMVKLPSIVFDAGVIVLLYKVVRRSSTILGALALAGLYAINPLTYLAGAAWGQVDSLPSLLLLASVLLILHKRWRYALPVYVLAVLMKPQALMAGPLGLLALVMQLLSRKDKTQRAAEIKDVLIGVLGSLALALAVAVPFFNEQNGLPWLLGLYGNTMGFYDHATVNATNLYYLFGLNWVDIQAAAPFLLRLLGGLVLAVPIGFAMYRYRKNRLAGNRLSKALAITQLGIALLPVLLSPLPMSLSAYGILMLACVFALIALQYILANDPGSLPLLAGVLLLGFSVLGTMMHERYLFLAAALITLAYILKRDRRILLLLLAVSALCFLNTGLVLDLCLRNGDNSVFLDSPGYGITSQTAWLEYALAFLSLPLVAYGVYLGQALFVEKAEAPDVRPAFIPARVSSEEYLKRFKPRPRVLFDRKDALVIILVTILYAVVALVNLGSLVSPQSAWASGPEHNEARLDLGEVRQFRLLFFAGIHWADSTFEVEVSSDGVNYSSYPFQIKQGGLFAWRYLGFPFQNSEGKTEYDSTPRELTGRYVRIANMDNKLTLMEIIAQDSQTGETLPFAEASPGAQGLMDEPDTFDGRPSWFNSMYFDEIYHARTALEQLNALTGQEPSRIYETTHPPLGKLLMTFSIMLFGMTPFGWRFAGAMAGVLMLPGMYLLGKQLTGQRSLGLFAMLLMAFDFMHFAQTRIATIDSFVTLFIIYAYFFMFRYVMLDHVRTGLKDKLIPLSLSGLMMGLAVASKWPGIYAGFGLAILFFASIINNMVKARYINRLPESALETQGEEAAALRRFGERWLIEPILTCLWCLLFFIAVPAVIYYLSYIPVYIATPGGLTIEKVINNNLFMLDYHAEPGRGADHYWSSPWYSWPIIKKPMYFYSGGIKNGTSSVIWSFGNPLVWWGGLVALFLTALAAVWDTRKWFKRPAQDNPVSLMTDKPKDIRPALLVLSFAVQYLPWALVPRGTYIYHYFPSVPFIILCITLMVDYTKAGWPRFGKWLMIALAVIAGALFIAFFPYISGVRVPTAWLEAMRWLPNWLYY